MPDQTDLIVRLTIGQAEDREKSTVFEQKKTLRSG